MKVARRAALAAAVAAMLAIGHMSYAQEGQGGNATSGAGQTGQGQQTGRGQQTGQGQSGQQQSGQQQSGQQQSGQQQSGQGQSSQQQSGQHAQKMDSALATCVLIEGQKQIAVCQYAMQKVQNQRVKQFAQSEIKEHQELKAKLEQKGYRPLVAMRGMSGDQQDSGVRQTSGQQQQPQQGGAPSPNDGVQQTRGQGSQGSGVQQAEGRQGSQGMQGGHPMLQIKQEVAEQCVATSRKELQQKQGAEFDKAFVGMQLAAHLQLHDEVTVFSRHASTELRGVLDEARPQIERHISQLKEIMQELQSGRQGQGSSESGSSNQ